MAAMEQVINWLADNRPDIAAVVRPHPAEDESYWQTKYQDADSVHVVTGTGHIPWTMAAEVLVHTTCSTGMEAAILGTPALSVTPHTQAAQHHYIISNQVNPSVETGDQASAALSAFLDDRSGPISHSEELAGRLSDQFPTLGQGGSAAAMVSEIKKMMGDAVDGDQYQWSLKPGESWTTIERRPEWQQKFSVDGQEVARRLEIMGNLVGLSRAINLQKIDDSLFYIFPA